ncbi:MAG: cytochrome b N-terminal domain-containing protein [Isosphaeraceae bacterium]|nr:cytochrome b N-terminal domain-containing protein [Isosphaeraceae bacterium]
MFNRLKDWFDGRTGYRALTRHVLDGPIPGGARWHYSLGSAVATAFLLQLVTGLLMVFTYVPSAEMAWGSVYFMQKQMTLGWVVQGLHHFGSEATVVLTGVHLVQVLLAGAYRAPREVNWWVGVVLLGLILALSATGYQLPWDQKAYWSTKIAAGFAGGVPLIGPAVRQVAFGGVVFGNQTLTRFFALHAAILPGLVVLVLVFHIILFQRSGVTTPRKAREGPAAAYWPEQSFRDALAGFSVLAIVSTLVIVFHGGPLDAPADPSSADYPARPEWYFLWLFQMLKHFPGDREYIGTLIIPMSIMAVMCAIPLFDRILPSRLAHFLACGFVFALFGGAGYLTYEALDYDARSPLFRQARAQADEARERAFQLAARGIPPEGSSYLLSRDPLFHGRDVLSRKCLSCHYYDGKGQGGDTPQTASDLKGFGTQEWLRGLLENPRSPSYFGKVKQCGGMARWRKNTKLTAKELDDVAEFFAKFVINTPSDMTPEEWEQQKGLQEHPGYVAFNKEGECVSCHSEWGTSNQEAPSLFGWGSTQWITRTIQKPGALDKYGYLEGKDQMPAFTSDQLTDNDLTTLVRFVKGEFLPPPPSHSSVESRSPVATTKP